MSNKLFYKLFLTSVMANSRLFRFSRCPKRLFILVLLLFTFISLRPDYGNVPDSEDDKDTSLPQEKLLINTSSCKIPDFPPWTEDARKLLAKKCPKYFQTEPKCEENHPHSWTYINGSYLFVNTTAVIESGYSWNSIRCCYRIISRVEQSLKKYDMMADRIIRFSPECYPIKTQKQLISAEFIRVFCMSTSLPTFNDIVSREFFAIPQLDQNAMRKINMWRESESSERPPNIIILGIDTMSRLNAYRNFEKTLKLLKSLGAVEMNGYTKVGETTFPNTVAFMSGHSLNTFTKHCYNHPADAQDTCPYLFKAFNLTGYLTTTMEDVPLGTSFNFLKTGFVHKPVDFYLRPLMLAVMGHQPRKTSWYLRCIGSKMIEQVILNYLEDIIASTHGVPLFAHVWLAVMAHECSLSAQYVDNLLSSFLERLDKSNTIIIFMGDHGEVFGPFRETLQGWYEDKLPTLWVFLPQKVRDKFPQWTHSLQTNSYRLTSHFDLYKTLVQILHSYDKDSKASQTYSKLHTQPGQSLFHPVSPNRTCTSAGIPEGYCACLEPKGMNFSDPVVKLAADTALQYITNMLPNQCATPSLKAILKAKYFSSPNSETRKVYLITFTTEPGNFMFEGTVREERSGKLVVTNDVLRMNKIRRKVDCINENLLERYCYCK